MKLTRAQVLLVLVAVIICFAQAFTFEFVHWDDEMLILQNEFVKQPSIERAYAAWLQPHTNLYIPLTYNVWATLATIGRSETPDFFGSTLNAYVFHSANILLHAASALLVFGILRKLLNHSWAATAGAILWAIHPIQVEPVAWATGMKDVLSGLLALAAIYFYVSAATSPPDVKPWRRRSLYAAAYLCMLLSPFAKPGVVAMPLGVLATDWLLIRRPLRKAVFASMPLFLAVLPATIITQLVQPSAGGADIVPLWARPFIAGHALAFYLQKLVWPDQFTFDYGQRPATVMAGWWWYVAWLIPAGVTALVLISRKARWPAAAWIIFLAGVAPVLGLIPFVFQYYSTVADRYVNPSMLGVALAFAVALTKLNRRTATALACILLLALGIRNMVQVTTWSSSVALHRHAMEVNPKSFVAPNSLGTVYGDQAAAIRKEVRGLNPSDPAVAKALTRADDLERAAEALVRRSVEIWPDFFAGLNNLASIQIARGQYNEALDSPQRAVDAVDRFPPQLTSQSVDRLVVGWAAMNLKRYDQAAENFRKFLARNPGHAEAESLLNEAEALAKASAATTAPTTTTQP